jgi:protease-4
LSINGPITSGEELIKVLYKMKKNPAIKALFLRLDSCGGALTSAEIIATELTNFKKEKPIVVFVENYCESAAYLIASAATTIFAGQFSMIGSIGVLYEIGYDKKVKTTCIAGGRFKRPTIDENYNIIDDEFIQHTQELINQEYEVMCTLLAQNRNLGIDFIKNLEGRIYASKDALELGLIDAIGSLSDAYIKIEELMKSNGNEINGPLVFVDAQGQEIFRL